MKFALTPIIVMFAGLNAAVAQTHGVRNHLVCPRETLSGIAKNSVDGPVYGPNGSLNQVLNLNPQISNADLIFVGDRIWLPPFLNSTEVPVTKIENRKLNSHRNAKNDLDEPLKHQKANASRARSVAKKLRIKNRYPASSEIVEPPAVPQAVKHLWIAGANYSFQQMKAEDLNTNRTATLNSRHDLNISTGWKINWTNRFATLSGAQLRSIQFEPSSNANRALQRSSQLLAKLDLSAMYRISPSLTLTSRLGFGKELFLKSDSSSGVTVAAVAMPSAGAEISSVLFRLGRTTFGIDASYDYLGAAKDDAFKVYSGSRTAASLRFKYAGRNLNVQLNTGVSHRLQRSSLASIDESSIFSQLTFTLPIFRGEQ